MLTGLSLSSPGWPMGMYPKLSLPSTTFLLSLCVSGHVGMPVSTRVVTGMMPAALLYHSLPYSLRQGFTVNPELGPVFADPSTRVPCTVPHCRQREPRTSCLCIKPSYPVSHLPRSSIPFQIHLSFW